VSYAARAVSTVSRYDAVADFYVACHRGRLSSALITSARTADRAAPLGIAYVVGDATHTNRLEPGPFDAVVCNFGLSDIDDLDALDTVAAALLLPGGLLVFSIPPSMLPRMG
jgi:ubiquinone/menaquinone biosynthesis C-methylase UbiE